LPLSEINFQKGTEGRLSLQTHHTICMVCVLHVDEDLEHNEE